MSFLSRVKANYKITSGKYDDEIGTGGRQKIVVGLG